MESVMFNRDIKAHTVCLCDKGSERRLRVFQGDGEAACGDDWIAIHSVEGDGTLRLGLR